MHDIVATAIPSVKSFIVGGDFNTNKDQDFPSKTERLGRIAGQQAPYYLDFSIWQQRR